MAMGKRTRVLLGVGAALVVVVAGGAWLVARGEDDFQRDADTVRMRHLAYYAAPLEEYHDSTGHYPLQDRQMPSLVLVAPTGTETIEGGPPFPHERVSTAAWFGEMSRVLGRRVAERYDPQLAAVSAPNFYIYVVTPEGYWLTVHPSAANAFTQRNPGGYHEIVVTSHPQPQRAHHAATLLREPAFQRAVATPLRRPDLFADRERQYERASRVTGDGE